MVREKPEVEMFEYPLGKLSEGRRGPFPSFPNPCWKGFREPSRSSFTVGVGNRLIWVK